MHNALWAGHELLRITAGAISASPPCVWALAVLADGTLASADSSGATQFWEGAHGTLLARYERHSADVLALAASTDGLAVFAAGVEPRVGGCRQERAALGHQERTLKRAGAGAGLARRVTPGDG